MIAMLMAALRPTVMGPVVLNDIGPVIETRGLARIIGYVGRMPVPKTWPDAVNILREMNERAFPSFSDAQWEEIAAVRASHEALEPGQAGERVAEHKALLGQSRGRCEQGWLPLPQRQCGP